MAPAEYFRSQRTPAVLFNLRLMLEAHEAEDWENAELVCDGAECWIGDHRTSRPTLAKMLRLGILRADAFNKTGLGSGHAERFTLNEEGIALARDPNYVPKLVSLVVTPGDL